MVIIRDNYGCMMFALLINGNSGLARSRTEHLVSIERCSRDKRNAYFARLQYSSGLLITSDTVRGKVLNPAIWDEVV